MIESWSLSDISKEQKTFFVQNLHPKYKGNERNATDAANSKISSVPFSMKSEKYLDSRNSRNFSFPKSLKTCSSGSKRCFNSFDSNEKQNVETLKLKEDKVYENDPSFNKATDQLLKNISHELIEANSQSIESTETTFEHHHSSPSYATHLLHTSNNFEAESDDSISSSNDKPTLQHALLHWRPHVQQLSHLSQDVNVIVEGKGVSKFARMMKLGLLQRWMNEDRKILNHEVLETQSVKLQSSPLPSFESYQPFSTNQPTNKLLPSSSIILQRNGMANQSESDEIEIDYEKTSEHIEKSENPKISTIDGAKTNVSERNVMTRRKRQLVKKQIHEAKKYKRAFGEWIRKDWITNEEEAHMWDIAEAKLKIANNNTLVDDYKKTKTESLNETVQIKSGKCDDAKEEGCEKADENFTEKQHNNRQTLEELKNQLKEEILAIAALTTATKSDQSTSFHSDEFNSGSSAPSSLGDAKAKLAELKEQISKKERKLAQKAVSCGLSDIERFSWLKDKTKVPDSRAYASESSFLTYFLSDNKVDPRFWSPPVPRPAVGCLFDSDKEEASEECEENTTEDEGGEEEEPTCQLFDGTQNIPSFPFPFLIDEEKDDFQTKQLQTSNSTTSENMKSTYILKQPPDISFDPLSISVSSLKQTSHSSLMNDSFRPTASTVILNGKNFTSNSSLLYRCSEYEQFREEKPCYVEFNSTFKAKNEEEKTNLLISSCLPKNSSQKGASAGNSVSSLELALSSFTQTGQLSFPPSLQSSSSSSSFASNTSVVCDLPPSLIPIDFSEMLPRFTDPTTNVRRIKRMRQRKINPMLFVQQSSLPFLEVKETPPLILPFFCYLNILICQRRRWDSMHYRKAEAQRRRNEMLKL